MHTTINTTALVEINILCLNVAYRYVIMALPLHHRLSRPPRPAPYQLQSHLYRHRCYYQIYCLPLKIFRLLHLFKQHAAAIVQQQLRHLGVLLVKSKWKRGNFSSMRFSSHLFVVSESSMTSAKVQFWDNSFSP